MSRGYNIFFTWTILLLAAIFAYKSVELGVLQQPQNQHERIFLGVLIAAVLTIGIGGEFLLGNCSFKWLLLFVFYLAAALTFLHTSMRANRPRLTARVYAYEAKSRFELEHPKIRNRTEPLRTLALSKLAVLQSQRNLVQSKINAKALEIKQAITEFRLLAQSVPRAERQAKRAELLQPLNKDMSSLVADRESLKKKIASLDNIVLRCNALMKPTLRRPLIAKEMDKMTLAAREEVHAIESALGAQLGRPGDPLILPVAYEQLSPPELYIWAVHHPLDKEVMPLWKALVLNSLLSVCSLLIGHLTHRIRHEGRLKKVISIDKQQTRSTRAA